MLVSARLQLQPPFLSFPSSLEVDAGHTTGESARLFSFDPDCSSSVVVDWTFCHFSFAAHDNLVIEACAFSTFVNRTRFMIDVFVAATATPFRPTR
jgi:hypothetical protein